MGKMKHKKYHRHDGDEAGDDEPGVTGSDGLKLILKVGSKSHDKHKKKKKKKDKKKERDKERKHRHHHKEKRVFDGEVVELPSNEGEVSIVDDSAKTATLDEAKPIGDCFLQLLEHILRHLERKDTNAFFANPVNDQLAPGYSTIISRPMDFSTMRSKLASYSTLTAFRADFELMCNNAMTYNTVDTIYYKTAKKMLHYGQKWFTADMVQSMRRHLEFAKHIPDHMLGVDNNVERPADDVSDDGTDDEDEGGVGDVSKVIEDIREVVRRPPGRFEAVPDDMTASEILEQARTAARGAANRLRVKCPKSRMGFLRQRADGSTSLRFLTGAAGVVPGTEKDRPVLLGSLIGKVKTGTGSMQGFREDRRNLAKAMHPLYYGAYSSHGPSYDSTFANLTKEETELVHNTYRDAVGVDYAESIMNFSRDCDYAMTLVDNLLDILTSNEHRKTSRHIEERKTLRKEEDILLSALPDAKDNDKEDIDFDSLRSLSEDGIDMSFLDTLQKHMEVKQETKEENESGEDKKSPDEAELLATNAQLIEELEVVQNERLGATPPVHFAQLVKPGDKEMELANTIQNNLVEIAGNMKPGQIVDPEVIRSIIGVKLPAPKRPKIEPEAKMEVN